MWDTKGLERERENQIDRQTEGYWRVGADVCVLSDILLGSFFFCHSCWMHIYIFIYAFSGFIFFFYFCVALDTYIGTSKMCTNEVMIHRNQMTHSIMPIYTENNTRTHSN